MVWMQVFLRVRPAGQLGRRFIRAEPPRGTRGSFSPLGAPFLDKPRLLGSIPGIGLDPYRIDRNASPWMAPSAVTPPHGMGLPSVPPHQVPGLARGLFATSRPARLPAYPPGVDAPAADAAEDESRTVDILKALSKHLWPDGEWQLKARVVASLGLLFGAKIITLQVSPRSCSCPSDSDSVSVSVSWVSYLSAKKQSQGAVHIQGAHRLAELRRWRCGSHRRSNHRAAGDGPWLRHSAELRIRLRRG